MSLFSWFKQKAAAAVELLGFQSAPNPQDYWDYAEEAYMKNPYAHAAIKLTANAAAQVPARIYRIKEKGPVKQAMQKAHRVHEGNRRAIKQAALTRHMQDKMEDYREHTRYDAVAKHYAKKDLIAEDIIEPVDNHELYGLLREPNPYTQRSFQEFIIAITSYLEIGGMVLIEPHRGSDATNGNISELRVRQPRSLRISRGGGQPISKIRVEDADAEDHTFNYDPDPAKTEVYYQRYFHPKYPRYGLSPVEAAARSVDMNNQAREQMEEVLEEVQDGTFARQWITENQAGRPNYDQIKTAEENHEIEDVGEELRGLFSWADE